METLSSVGADINQLSVFEQSVQTFILSLSDETKLIIRAIISIIFLIIEIKLGWKLYSFSSKYYKQFVEKRFPTVPETAKDKACGSSTSSDSPQTPQSAKKQKGQQARGKKEASDGGKRPRGRNILNRKALGKQRSAPSAAASAASAAKKPEVGEVSQRGIPTKKSSNKQTADTSTTSSSPSPSLSSSNPLIGDLGEGVKKVLNEVTPSKLVDKIKSTSNDSTRKKDPKKDETTMNDHGCLVYIKYVLYKIKRLLTLSRYIGKSHVRRARQVRTTGKIYAIVRKIWHFIIWPVAWMFKKY